MVSSRVALYSGWTISVLSIAFLLFDAIIHFANPQPVIDAFAMLGIPDRLHTAIAVIELGCIVLYAIPRTNVLGAILLTGYLGGATAIAVRADYQWYFSVFIGVLVWAGLYLRDDGVRALMPLRRRAS
jgi:hypothetical protein